MCIVGAGPAGISIARDVIGNGARVWLLDSGGRGHGTPRSAAEPAPGRRLPDPPAASVAKGSASSCPSTTIPAAGSDQPRTAPLPLLPDAVDPGFQKIIDVALRAAGLSHVELMRGDESPPDLLNGNFHHLGTTRMHPAAGRLNR